ncbi:uncharacterized protein LACBIDRAFT_309706 [Laccaria bicolor S238N-H82]|uniref:Predicted protein n=1 Tax=Laccaria bicolor (strain S238N-H82 / ATCC MYA-4686) TaxID=486041 RepID=B0DSW3_LACBS|nr:uncharacterized protein LACBIDRAFT_309706 [Laccaria bicolor S238N-H82]EDR02314.1 predicted protein [Laccaria bicolor S238N-H82]|eukprot:XP_001886991.1 predicted protein [Laccaria bicolor S238N-H82]
MTCALRLYTHNTQGKGYGSVSYLCAARPTRDTCLLIGYGPRCRTTCATAARVLTSLSLKQPLGLIVRPLGCTSPTTVRLIAERCQDCSPHG